MSFVSTAPFFPLFKWNLSWLLGTRKIRSFLQDTQKREGQYIVITERNEHLVLELLANENGLRFLLYWNLMHKSFPCFYHWASKCTHILFHPSYLLHFLTISYYRGEIQTGKLKPCVSWGTEAWPLLCAPRKTALCLPFCILKIPFKVPGFSLRKFPFIQPDFFCLPTLPISWPPSRTTYCMTTCIWRLAWVQGGATARSWNLQGKLGLI